MMNRLSHSSQNGNHQENKQKMLVRMQGKRTSYILSMGMYISAATRKISMELPQETKSRTPI
jgi:hypothetical protein